jgi:hypothetical protein
MLMPNQFPRKKPNPPEDDPMKQEKEAIVRGGESPSLYFSEENDFKFQFFCSVCGNDMTLHFLQELSHLTKISTEDFQNGGLKFLPTFVSVGKYYLEVSGIKYNDVTITEKTSERIIEMIEKVMKPHLEKMEKENYEREIKMLSDEINQLRDKVNEKENEIDKINRDKEKVESDFIDFKTRVMSNPALKGALAQADLLEDLEANFPEQHFEDISKDGGGDVLWPNILANIGKWIETDVGAIIDSKDKGSITESDIEKLKRDMKFGKKEIGLIIAAKQEQLRLKETPCGVYKSEEGFILVTSRENLNHHITMRFARDILARLIYESRSKEKVIDISKLSAVLNDIAKTKEYHKKIKSKAQGIIKDVDSEESYLNQKIQDAWKILSMDTEIETDR